MNTIQAHDVLTALITLTTDFLDQLERQDELEELEAEEVLFFLEERQCWLRELENAQDTRTPETDVLCQKLLELNKGLNTHLAREQERVQQELIKIRQNRKGLQGYQNKPARGRKTLEVKG